MAGLNCPALYDGQLARGPGSGLPSDIGFALRRGLTAPPTVPGQLFLFTGGQLHQFPDDATAVALNMDPSTAVPLSGACVAYIGTGGSFPSVSSGVGFVVQALKQFQSGTPIPVVPTGPTGGGTFPVPPDGSGGTPQPPTDIFGQAEAELTKIEAGAKAHEKLLLGAGVAYVAYRSGILHSLFGRRRARY